MKKKIVSLTRQILRILVKCGESVCSNMLIGNIDIQIIFEYTQRYSEYYWILWICNSIHENKWVFSSILFESNKVQKKQNTTTK